MAGAGVRADDHHGDRRGRWVVAESLQDLLAAQVGQVQVQKHDGGVVLTGQFQAQAAVHGGDDVDVGPLGQDPLDQGEVGQVVLDVQHHPTSRRRLHGGLGPAAQAFVAFDGAFDPGQLQGEGAALPESAGRLQGAAHDLGQPPGQGQTDAGALLAAVFGPESFERGEQQAQVLRRDPHAGICHVDAYPGIGRQLPGDDNRAPGPVVLHRVGQQVQKHLLDPLAVGEHEAVATR